MAEVSARMLRKEQRDAYSSPWPWKERVRVGMWNVVYWALFRPTPKYLYHWRILLLRLFGASIGGRPFVAPSAVINRPWNLMMEDKACIGEKAEIYNLATVLLESGATVAQQAYLCGGTHDFTDPASPLLVGRITVSRNAFVGARAFILPGVTVGEGAVVGACSVVTKDIPAWSVCAGNPCRVVRGRFSPSNAAE